MKKLLCLDFIELYGQKLGHPTISPNKIYYLSPLLTYGGGGYDILGDNFEFVFGIGDWKLIKPAFKILRLNKKEKQCLQEYRPEIQIKK